MPCLMPPILLNSNVILIDKACEAYQIGRRLSEPIPCVGGLLHRVYQFDTSKCQFVIKFLNPAICSRPSYLDRYRITECIAGELSKHTSVINAMLYQNNPFFIFNDETVMVFSYVKGKPLMQKKIRPYHVKQIAHALSKIHQANISVDNAPPVEPPSETLFKITSAHFEISKQFQHSLPMLEFILKNILKYEGILKNNLVISHRDCDPKNVLWDADDHFYIIDWESAGLINKKKDVIATAIYWSLDDSFKINLDHLSVFLKAYQEENPNVICRDEIEAGFYGFMGDWLGWLEFNLLRIQNNSESSEEYSLGVTEASKTLSAIPVLLTQLPEIISESLKCFT